MLKLCVAACLVVAGVSIPTDPTVTQVPDYFQTSYGPFAGMEYAYLDQRLLGLNRLQVLPKLEALRSLRKPIRSIPSRPMSQTRRW